MFLMRARSVKLSCRLHKILHPASTMLFSFFFSPFITPSAISATTHSKPRQVITSSALTPLSVNRPKTRLTQKNKSTTDTQDIAELLHQASESLSQIEYTCLAPADQDHYFDAAYAVDDAKLILEIYLNPRATLGYSEWRSPAFDSTPIFGELRQWGVLKTAEKNALDRCERAHLSRCHIRSSTLERCNYIVFDRGQRESLCQARAEAVGFLGASESQE